MFKKAELKRILLLLGDILLLELGLWISLSLRHLHFTSIEELLVHIPQFSVLFIFWIITNYINQLYDLDQKTETISFYRKILKAASIALGIGIIFFYLTPIDSITPKTVLVLDILVGYCLITLWRKIFFNLLIHKTPKKKVIFVGRTEEVDELKQILKKKYTNTYQVVSVSDNARYIQKRIEEKNIDIAIIAPHLKEDTRDRKKLSQLLFKDLEVKGLYQFYEEITGRVPFSAFHESWFVNYLGYRKGDELFSRIRRIIDLFVGFILGLATIVLYPILALIIKLESSGPIIVKTKRIGKDEEVFDLYKFRITEDNQEEIDLEDDKFDKTDKHTTKVGDFLRKTRLDEIPQFWNLIKGDLTIIGPRPEKPEVVKKMKQEVPYFDLRHIVKPGLTSWAVLHQNYVDTFDETTQKLQYDLYYTKNRSLILDLSIILRSINVVLQASGK
ncbi:MAG: sugar transferase [Candidatus Magasanikbacteria bacterium]